MIPTNLAFGTPTLTVRSSRGASVRMLRYNRESAEEAVRERIERTTYDALGRVASLVDARFFAQSGSPQPNFVYLSSLSGHVLRTDSVDAGTHWMLPDVDGRPVWACDGRDTVTTFTYDELGRPLTVQETLSQKTPAIRDRWVYGETRPDAQANNLRGRCVCRYDTAGQLSWSGFRLTGQPIAETRQLLADADGDPDWSSQDPAALAGTLDAAPYQTAWTHDATGTWVTQTDAKQNVQQRDFDVAGRLASSRLTLASGTKKSVLSAIGYTAAGQVLSETAGNGAISTYAYEPQTQRLIGLTVTRPAQASRATVVQDLSYEYDPVGNVVQVSDAAQATSYWRNQKIQATHTYGYDALYQLINATGREMANRGPQAQGLPPATIPLPADDSVYANYNRTYTYDPGGNLAMVQHQGIASYTQTIVISAASNHALLQNSTETLTPANIDDGKNTWFDAAGNQRRLVPDAPQPLVWDGRDRLRRVPLVTRPQDVDNDDHETYQYGGDGMRVRKRTTTVASSVTRTVDAIYLPGLTLRITSSGDGKTMTVTESMQEMASEAGSIRVRCLHWEAGLPTSLTNDRMRYGMGDRTGSISLELDDQAALISREEYYPYGGTSVWTARSQIEADTKFVRYSGKERDATGLYYYGHRYYQPWIGRWLNSDPAGLADGFNLYCMVRNNPMTLSDSDGLVSEEPRYRVSPFNDPRSISDYVDDLVVSGAHRIEHGKHPIQPVFVNEEQRLHIREHIVSDQRYWSEHRTAHELEAAKFLADVSKPDKAIMSFAGMARPRIELWGHGLPGEPHLVSNGFEASQDEIVDMLKRMKLPRRATLYAISCWSAAGHWYPGNSHDWWDRFHAGTLDEVSDTEQSFAADLHRQLSLRGFEGVTIGYLTQTKISADVTLDKGGEIGSHMAGVRRVLGPTGRAIDVDPHEYPPRRRDLRVQWGPEETHASGGWSDFPRYAYNRLVRWHQTRASM